MKPKFVLPMVFILITIGIVSCSKDSSNSGGGKQLSLLEKRADSLYHYVKEKHFIPVDFYSLDSIDYNQEDAVIELNKDLRKFILPYLADDTITFKDGGSLEINQGDSLISNSSFGKIFYGTWDIGTIKASKEVFLMYLSYTYKPK